MPWDKKMKVRICPDCEEQNNSLAWNCANCGRTLPVNTIVDLPLSSTVPPLRENGEDPDQGSATDVKEGREILLTSSGVPGGNYCWQCGEKIFKGGNFCHSCGARLPETGEDEIKQPYTLMEDSDEMLEDQVAKPREPLSDMMKAYYWTNLILNPTLLVLLLIPDIRGYLIGITIGWVFLSGLINPRFRSAMGDLIGGGIETVVAIIVSSCYVILFGGIVLIILAAIMIVLGALCYMLAVYGGLIALWVSALSAILNDSK